jgi:isopropylmalate/homocitrate/citramalate synthase
MAPQVLLYDTTLRDGMQGEGMSLSVDEKVRVAHALDGLGVHFIEAGFPARIRRRRRCSRCWRGRPSTTPTWPPSA